MNISLHELGPFLEQLVKEGRRVRLTVKGTSMLPFIKNGDIVEIGALGSIPRVGDILLVRQKEGSYVLHRVVEVNGASFFLRGDSTSGTEGPFREKEVVGSVFLCLRAGRPRNLTKGWWRVLGIIWARSFPINILTIQGLLKFKQLAVRFLRALSPR